jgi:hypothetical protein
MLFIKLLTFHKLQICNNTEKMEVIMANKEDSEAVKIQGRLTVTQGLWDYERTQILKALGITGDINVRSWTTESLVE